MVFKPPGIMTRGTSYRPSCTSAQHGHQSSARCTVMQTHVIGSTTDRGPAPWLPALCQHVQACSMFAERRIHKRYRALILGKLDGEGTVDSPLDGKSCLTRGGPWSRRAASTWTVHDRRSRAGDRSDSSLRRHMAEMDHPILEDEVYTGRLTPQAAGTLHVLTEL